MGSTQTVEAGIWTVPVERLGFAGPLEQGWEEGEGTKPHVPEPGLFPGTREGRAESSRFPNKPNPATS